MTNNNRAPWKSVGIVVTQLLSLWNAVAAAPYSRDESQSLGKERHHWLAAVRDGHGTRAVHEFLRRINAHRRMNRGMEVNQRNRIFRRLLGQLIRRAIGTAMLQASTCQHHAERRALMSTATTAIELWRAAKLGADHDQSLIEKLLLLEISNQCGQCLV